MKPLDSEDVSGLILVDKPQGLTSFDVVKKIRRLSGQKSVGHTGTLDPLATGLLVVMLGKATKLLPWLIKMDKTYTGAMVMGLKTDSDDVTGQILSEYDGPWPDRQRVLEILKDFTGECAQKPPAYSAIKVAGRAAYKTARAGQLLDLPARPVSAYELELLDWQPPLLLFRAMVSSGYYIRSLARDLGLSLGLGGGALETLRRQVAGPFKIQEAGALPEDAAGLKERLISPRAALGHLPEFMVGPEEARKIVNGQILEPATGLRGLVKVVTDGRLLAMAEILDSENIEEIDSPRRPLLRSLRVFTTAI